MKTLLHKKLDLTHAVDVTPACEKVKLFRTALDHYAVAEADFEIACFAFKSKVFSKLIHTFSSPIIDIVATKSVCLLSDHTHFQFGLKLILGDGTAYQIDEHSRIENVVPVTMMDKAQQPTVSAHGIFELPDIEPYNRMLLSAGFYSSLISAMYKSKTINEKSVIDQLWNDFRIIEGGPHIDKAVFSKSEHIQFAATELSCGRILFLTVFEGMEITFPNTPYRNFKEQHERN